MRGRIDVERDLESMKEGEVRRQVRQGRVRTKTKERSLYRKVMIRGGNKTWRLGREIKVARTKNRNRDAYRNEE